VAPDLLGRLLVRRVAGGELLVGRIVECEAYQEDDPASHSHRGPTQRTSVMFGPPGHLYVYLSYGMHWCCNVVTGDDGEGSAVLLRAVEPVEGIEHMRALRSGIRDDRLVCAGPGRLTRAFAISGSHNGLDLVEGRGLWVSTGRPLASAEVEIGPRVGISVARDRTWRFRERGSPFASPPRRRFGPSLDPSSAPP
jgi:DNA-3-methyladenine glycosylase